MKLNRDRLIRLRRHFNWLQPEAARAAGISTQAYSRAESGYGIRPSTASAIIGAFRRQLERQTAEEIMQALEEIVPQDETASTSTVDAVAADPF